MLKKVNKYFLISFILDALIFLAVFLVLVKTFNSNINITSFPFGAVATSDYFIVLFIISLLSLISNLISLIYHEKLSIFLTIFFNFLLLILGIGDIASVIGSLLIIVLLIIGYKKDIR